MDKQFTASEVRAWFEGMVEQGLVDELTLQYGLAFADLLEAREKAKPVAWRTFDGEGNYDYRDYENNEHYRDWYVSRNGAKYANWVEPLYSHAAPADTERLAEALRRTCRKMKTFSRTGALDGAVAVWVDEIESALAAHSAQAQPPAASVPDGMQELADKYHELLWAVARKFPGETRHETALRYIREAECQEAAVAAQENPNG